MPPAPAPWADASLAGGVALPGPGSQAPTEPISTLLTQDANGWQLFSFEPRRDEQGRQLPVGCQVLWWGSADAGTTWTPGTPGRPVEACHGGFFYLRSRADGSVALFELAAPVVPNPVSFVQQSVAGSFRPWDSCEPGPGADCAFVTMTGAGAANANWRGIDLVGATLRDVALHGATLTKANLGGATIDGDLSGTDLQNAFADNATLGGNLAHANLSGVQLFLATVTAALAGANLTGLLAFSATFSGDMSGARVSGARFDGSTFLAGTTCPNGKVLSKNGGPSACGL